MINRDNDNHCLRSDQLIKSSDCDVNPANTSIPNSSLLDLQKLDSQFNRVEASFQASASRHKLPHRRLLALNWVARFHGIPAGTFQKAFEMWLQASIEGGEI